MRNHRPPAKLALTSETIRSLSSAQFTATIGEARRSLYIGYSCTTSTTSLLISCIC